MNSAALDRCLVALDRGLGASKIDTRPESLEAHARDDSEAEGIVPAAVVRAESADDIAAALAICAEHDTHVFPRAAGSGRTGGAVPTRPGVVLATIGMAAIKEIDRANQLCVVEPGVIAARLHETVEAEGLFYPPDPNSLEVCALGGNVAENAGGPRAFKYGVTREYVLGLDAVTMGGTRLRTGKRTVKGVTGYDVTALLVGSEGTLAVFSEITLQLLPKPEGVRTLFATFRTAVDAGRAVSRIVERGLVPRCLELMDAECCAVLRDANAVALAPEVGAILLTEVDGDEVGLDAAMERVGECCADCGAIDVLVASHGGERAKLWAARRTMSPSLRKRAKFKLSEDIVVPRSRLGETIERVREIGERHGLRLPTYGHAGDGNLHVNFLWDDADGRARVHKAIEDVFRLTLAFGGTLSGEHGIGILKRPYLHLEQSNDLIDLQRRIKSAFDPKGLLNPDKIFPPPGHRAC